LTGPRLIGFTARVAAACFHAACRTPSVPPSTERLTARLHPSTFVSPLQSSFGLILRPCPFGAGDLPGFLPSSRHDQGASTDREASQASLRSVHRRSQPHDGLLRASAPGLVSSPSRVQGSSRSGASLSAQRARLVAGSCLLAVATTRARRTLRVTAAARIVPRPRGFHPRGGACSPPR